MKCVQILSLFLWLSSLFTTTCAYQGDVDGSIISSDSKHCTSPFKNILSPESYFLDLMAIDGDSTLRIDNQHISIGGLLPLNLNLTLSCCV